MSAKKSFSIGKRDKVSYDHIFWNVKTLFTKMATAQNRNIGNT